MEKVVKICRPPMDQWDMEKVLKILKKNIDVTVDGKDPAQRDSIVQEQAIFRFVHQVLNERPALFESLFSAILNSNPILSKYILTSRLTVVDDDFDVDSPQKSLELLVAFMLSKAQHFFKETIVPEGTLMN